MSFTDDKREVIKRYILDKIERKADGLAKNTAENFEISLNTVYRYIRELEKNQIIKKSGSEWQLVSTINSILLNRTKGDLFDEDMIYQKYIQQYIAPLNDNIKRIWHYSFTEMMNNAIEHSDSEEVVILVEQNYMNTTILLADNGIGIFKKIKDFYGYDNLDDAVRELFKGKLTTDSKNHSGEGIFFTSRVLDDFAAISAGKIFNHNNFSETLWNLSDIEELQEWQNNRGTLIFMSMSNFSNKILKEVFDMFSNDDGEFTKTRIPVKNIFDTFPVSRSQAKRLCHRFENFDEVELDFEGIDEIGQGFAHEIFVVFQNEHPDISLIPLNTMIDVKKMINHVLKSK